MPSFPFLAADGRLGRTLLFVASAALAAWALRLAWTDPLAGAALLTVPLVLLVLRWRERRRVRALLRDGDVTAVLSHWSRAIQRAPHRETLAPLMTATAFAAFGWVREARAALEHAARGPAWEAALEHRLFLETMLLTFEGDREEAMERSARLDRLPLPPAGAALQERVRTLRAAIGAMARAFAHATRPGDRALLEAGGETSPLVHWALRYAAAILAIDEGRPDAARALLVEAPTWPETSAFHAFHRELLERAGPATHPTA